MIKWLLHRLIEGHDWMPVSAWHYNDTSDGARVPSTVVGFTCNKCGSAKSKIMYGVHVVYKNQLRSKP